MINSDVDRNERARKRVKLLKGFFTHLTVYLVINTTIIVIKIIGTTYYGETFMGPIWHFSTFLPWFFWGIGLAFHAVKVFKLNPFFNENWEKRQIQKYIEGDQKDVEKYE